MSRAIVVDDPPLIRLAVRIPLEMARHEIATMRDPAPDLPMPRMDGFSATSPLKERRPACGSRP